MDLRRYSVVGTLLVCVAALTLPSTAEAKGGKKGKAKSEASAETKSDGDEGNDDGPADDEEKDGEKDADAEPAEEEYVEPDAWERPPVEEEPPPVEEKPEEPEDEPHGDGRSLGIGLLISYGFGHENSFGSTNPYSLGFGLRGGYTLDFGLYVGGMFTYFLGTSDDANSGGGTGTTGGTINASSNYLEILAEVGYDLWVSKFVIRPYIGLGVGVGLLEGTTLSGPVNSFAFAPGASVFYNINAVFIGADLRFNLMGGNGVDGTVISLFGGMRF